MTTMQFDEGAARRLETTYMAPDIVKQRAVTLKLLALSAGETVVDIGSGPGFLCDTIAAQVGPTGKVIGIDISPAMVEAASKHKTHAWLSYRQGDATAVDLPDGCADVAVSTQVLEYVADVDRATAEMYRIAKPGGRVLAMATDWGGTIWHSSDPARMAVMLRAWEAHCADPRLPRVLAPKLAANGFKVGDVVAHPIVNMRLGIDTYSEGIMMFLANFVRRREPSLDVDGWLADLRSLSDQGRYFFASTRFIFLATKPQQS